MIRTQIQFLQCPYCIMYKIRQGPGSGIGANKSCSKASPEWFAQYLLFLASSISLNVSKSRLKTQENTTTDKLLWWKVCNVINHVQDIEYFHMTSRRPYWFPKTMKWRPCWSMKHSCGSWVNTYFWLMATRVKTLYYHKFVLSDSFGQISTHKPSRGKNACHVMFSFYFTRM